VREQLWAHQRSDGPILQQTNHSIVDRLNAAAIVLVAPETHRPGRCDARFLGEVAVCVTFVPFSFHSAAGFVHFSSHADGPPSLPGLCVAILPFDVAGACSAASTETLLWRCTALHFHVAAATAVLVAAAVLRTSARTTLHWDSSGIALRLHDDSSAAARRDIGR
jgi:hypothetical protein